MYVQKSMWQLCGWGRVDICMTFHMRAFDFFFCSTVSEFENFLLCERILINVTTCQNEMSS
jgi:hypothetical protein